jgi:hypothetical protein
MKNMFFVMNYTARTSIYRLLSGSEEMNSRTAPMAMPMAKKVAVNLINLEACMVVFHSCSNESRRDC